MNPYADKDYPSLYYFLGAYLHQDWELDYANIDEAIRAFAKNDRHRVEQLIDDVALLLSTANDEEVRRIVLDEYRSNYLPDPTPMRQWLADLATELSTLLTPDHKNGQ